MNGLKTDVLNREGSFHKHTAIKEGFSQSDAEFVSVSMLDIKGQSEFTSKLKVAQIEDGIEFGIVKKIEGNEVPVWYFLNIEEIEILLQYLGAVMPGITSLHKEDSGLAGKEEFINEPA